MFLVPIKRSSLRTERSEVWQSVLRDCFTMFAMTIAQHCENQASRSEILMLENVF
jgi:hypothetical protein